MNTAHFHLITNHFPIVALAFGSLVLLAGLLLKNRDVSLTGLTIFIFGALTSILAFYTGEGAEDVVENLQGISKELINEHEELAETFLNLTLVLGGVALIAFIAEVKKFRYSKALTILCFVLAIANGILAVYVGETGGKIRHSEISSTAGVTSFINTTSPES